MMNNFKKICVILTLLLSLAATPAFSKNKFYLKEDTNIEPGTSPNIEFMLDNSSEFYGFQAEITLPAGLEIENKSDITLNSDRTDGSYQVISNQINGTWYIAAFSSSNPQPPIEGDSGVLLSIKVSAADTFIGGDLKISKIKFVDKDDNDVPFEDDDDVPFYCPEYSTIGVLPISITLSPEYLSLYKYRI